MFFFDSYAIIELFAGNPAYAKYASEQIVTSAMNLGEVQYHYLKYGHEQQFFQVLSQKEVECLEILPKTVYSAMRLRYENRKKRLSIVDCVGYTLAEENGLTFLTGDKEFEKMPGVEFVK